MIINAASEGDQLRGAAGFVAAIQMVDLYGSTLRDKVFARTKELLDDRFDMGMDVGSKALDEVGSLAEALSLLNP